MKALILSTGVALATVVSLVVVHAQTRPSRPAAAGTTAAGIPDLAGTWDPSGRCFLNGETCPWKLAATRSSSSVQWQVEMGSTTLMTRQGWTPASIKPGDPIKVVGQPSRAEGTHGICCAQVSRADGSPFVAVRGGRGTN